MEPTFKITEKQYNKLAAACQLARAPRGCSYVLSDGSPGCVIGQLAYAEGISTKDMQRWQSKVVSVVVRNFPVAKPLGEYPIHLLANLQSFWDTKTPDSVRANPNAQLVARLQELVEVK